MPAAEISVILPVYNEQDNIPLLHAQLKQALDALSRSYEIVYVDDGSKDASFLRLSYIASHDPTVTVIRFRRNFGQTAAMAAGLDQSQGSIVILMDADLQNDPADIARLLEKIDEGYDVVSGWRKNRKDAFINRKLPSMLANRLISKVTGVHLHDYGCSLKAYRREVLENVRLYGEMHRFIPAYASWNGALITEIPVNHHARKYGKSKYGIGRTIRVLLDLITVKFLGTYTTKPIYAFGFISIIFGLASVASLGVTVAQALTPPYVRIHNNPLTLLSAILLVVAIQVILMGLLAELIMRTYYESQGKVPYRIRSIVTAASAAARTHRPTALSGVPALPTPTEEREAASAAVLADLGLRDLRSESVPAAATDSLLSAPAALSSGAAALQPEA
jgi:glycosyltransferase involved in cell wall biosynthesis